MMIRSIFITALLNVTCALAADYPGEAWPVAAPTDVGLDAGRLQQARDYALTGGGSGCIIRHGRMVMLWGDPKHRYDLKSSTKSFGAAALGLAIKDGKLRLDDKARLHHPTLGTPPDTNARSGWLDDMTILHLASQTAGFEKPGGYTPLLFQPGTQWDYSDSGPNWLAECITLAYLRDVDALMFDRVFGPLGILRSDLVWRKNAYRPDLIDGIKRREFGSGISANVGAMARFGLLFLHEGQWNGKEILPRAFVDQVRTTVPGVPGLPVRKPADYGKASSHYGLLWWNNADETIQGVPPETYWSWGLYDSLIVVMPTLDIVVSRAGQSWKRTQDADPYDVLKSFLLPIVASVSSSPSAQEVSRPGAMPYAQSSVIRGIEWAPAHTILQLAKGSDNWPMTWADDDSLYTAYGDGNGFEPFVKGKLSMGLAKVIGVPPDIRGMNLRSETAETKGDGKSGRKACGMLCVNGVLYLLVRNAGNSQLGWSTDHGATWTWADWKFTTSFGCPTFLNFGRNYGGARDDYVYVYSPDHDTAYERADRFVLARVPTARLRDHTAYEYFMSLDDQGQPQWTRAIGERGAVFTSPGNCYRSGISYHSGLNRYLWCQTGKGHEPRFKGGFAVYDAPEPWGPWTTAFHTDNWDIGPGETNSFPTKWMNADGRTLYLVSSSNDYFTVRQATLILSQQRVHSTETSR